MGEHSIYTHVTFFFKQSLHQHINAYLFASMDKKTPKTIL